MSGLCVSLDGSDHTQARPAGLESLELEDHVERIGRVRLELALGSWYPRLGAPVRVEADGSGGFRGRVVAWRLEVRACKTRLWVCAEDVRGDLWRRASTRAFERRRDDEIVRTVLSEAGVEVDSVARSDVCLDHVLQHAESDLDFLWRISARNGWFVRATAAGMAVGPPSRGRVVRRSAALAESLVVDVDGREVCGAVRVRGLDASGVPFESTVSLSDIPAIGLGDAADVVAPHVAMPEWGVAGLQVHGRRHAEAVAGSELGRRARSLVRLTGTWAGLDGPWVGECVEIVDLPALEGVQGLVVRGHRRWTAEGGAHTELRVVSDRISSRHKQGRNP